MTRHSLGALQHAIMQILWNRGEATTNDVHRALYDQRRLAPTTIATMLRKMEEKGVVTHRRDGRAFVYRPTVTESEVQKTMVNEIVDRLFCGDPAALVSHLIQENTLDAAGLERLRSAIETAEEAEDDRT